MITNKLEEGYRHEHQQEDSLRIFQELVHSIGEGVETDAEREGP